jgi:hypothetical protein
MKLGLSIMTIFIICSCAMRAQFTFEDEPFMQQQTNTKTNFFSCSSYSFIIPSMSNSNAPYGNATASSFANRQPYEAFIIGSDNWPSQFPDSLPEWVQYQFPFSTVVTQTVYTSYSGGAITGSLKASNDGTNFTILCSIAANAGGQTVTNNFINTLPYIYYRWQIDSDGGVAQVELGSVNLLGCTNYVTN